MIELKEAEIRNGAETVLRCCSEKFLGGHVYGIFSERIEEGARVFAAMAGAAPYKGQIKINGYDVRKQPRKARLCVGYLPLGAPLDEMLTVEEVLETAARARGLSYERTARQMQELLDLTSLAEIRARTVSALSTADRRLLGIAQAAVGGGDVLFLTDPAGGLRKEEREEIFLLLDCLKVGKTVFVVSDTETALPPVCELLFLQNGNLTEVSDRGTLAALSKTAVASPDPEKRVSNKKRAPKRIGDYEIIEENPKC